jgi:hypothetical protein
MEEKQSLVSTLIGQRTNEEIQEILQVQGYDLWFNNKSHDHMLHVSITWRDEQVFLSCMYDGRIQPDQRYGSVHLLLENEPWDLSRFTIIGRPTYRPDYD